MTYLQSALSALHGLGFVRATSSERRGRRKSLLPSGCPLERRSKVHHDLFPLFPHTSSPITPLVRGPPGTCRRSSRGRDVRGRPRRVLRAERLLLYPPNGASTSRGDILLFNVPGPGSQFQNHRLQLRPGRVRRSPVAYSRKLEGRLLWLAPSCSGRRGALPRRPTRPPPTRGPAASSSTNCSEGILHTTHPRLRGLTGGGGGTAHVRLGRQCASGAVSRGCPAPGGILLPSSASCASASTKTPAPASPHRPRRAGSFSPSC